MFSICCAEGWSPRQRGVSFIRLLLEVEQMDAEDFPYDPEFGEPYNSRERFFVARLGKVAGWLHAGRPRREAARIALRIYVRDQLLELVSEVEGSPVARLRSPVGTSTH